MPSDFPRMRIQVKGSESVHNRTNLPIIWGSGPDDNLNVGGSDGFDGVYDSVDDIRGCTDDVANLVINKSSALLWRSYRRIDGLTNRWVFRNLTRSRWIFASTLLDLTAQVDLFLFTPIVQVELEVDFEIEGSTRRRRPDRRLSRFSYS